MTLPATIPTAAVPLLRPGVWVEVRTPAEIMATLDAEGRLEGLPFMPEMLPFCGRRMRVYRRADKTCAVAEQTAIRRMRNAVHLTDARCDGGAHGGCQNGCLFFWKEAWLRPVEGPVEGPSEADRDAGRSGPSALPAVDESRLVTSITSLDGETTYVCQATELWGATAPLPWHEPGQYARDLRGGLSPGQILIGLMATAKSRVEKLRRRAFGRQGRTPTERIDLAAGDLVEVKQRREIDATLDARGCNRGLWWDPEMYASCGKQFRVLRPLERVVDEGTGRLRVFKEPTVLLEGGVCTGATHRFCSRSSYAFWREIWLRRV